MDNKFRIEIKRFMKNNYKKVIVLSLIIGLVYTLASNLIFNNSDTENNGDPEIVTEELAEFFTGFKIFIEFEDGRPFENTTLLEEYILKPELIEEVESNTGVSILNKINELEESGFEKSGDNRGVLGVIRGNHSDIFTIVVNVGSRSENERVAKYYFDKLTTENISFLENKNIYVWSDPELLLDYESDIIENNALINDMDNRASNFVTDMILGTVFGVLASLLFITLLALLKNREIYSFSYNRGTDDIFLIYDSSLNNTNEIAQLIMYPKDNKKVIIHNAPIPEKLKMALNTTNKTSTEIDEPRYVNNITDVNDISENTEIVIVLNSAEDSKKWYKLQRKIVDTYQIPVKVLQVNP